MGFTSLPRRMYHQLQFSQHSPGRQRRPVLWAARLSSLVTEEITGWQVGVTQPVVGGGGELFSFYRRGN